MAYYRKTKTGWRVEIERRGVRTSKTFTTKAAAQAWATREETAIIDGAADRWPRKTLADALKRYEEEVSPTKRVLKLERHTFGMMLRDHPELCATVLHKITAADLSAWRDQMAKRLSGATVQRYINTLRSVWTVAAREWGWCPEPTPWRSIRMPDPAPPREKLIGWREARAILRRLNYRTGRPPESKGEQVAYALLVSLRTAMRAGEVLGLTGESVDLASRVVTLARHKTDRAVGKRQVPLTKHGARLLKVLHKPGPLFDLSAASLDALFRKARGQVLISDLHFHDARATALTHLARKVDVMTLARISGHRDVSLLLNVYFRESAAQIAARLG